MQLRLSSMERGPWGKQPTGDEPDGNPLAMGSTVLSSARFSICNVRGKYGSSCLLEIPGVAEYFSRPFLEEEEEEGFGYHVSRLEWKTV